MITNIINNKVYIGQTNKQTPLRRWSEHKCEAKRGLLQFPIYRALRKYGYGSFLFSVIIGCKGQKNANYLEAYLVKKYDSRNPIKGYNVNAGGKVVSGEDHWNFGRHRSEETKQKLRQANLGKKHSEETKKRISESSADNGRPINELWKKRDELMSQHNKGSTYQQLAEKYHVSKDLICRIILNKKYWK